MTMWPGLRKVVVESPGSLGARARLRRWQIFHDLWPDLDQLRVVDLGGTPEFWQASPVQPRHVTVLNLFGELPVTPDWITAIRGDACAPPDELLSGSYDLAYSNSVIEHVGGAYRRQQFAEVVRAVAARYWVQTPYRYFPVEPHWLFPGAQFLPVRLRARVVGSWPLVNARGMDPQAAMATVLNTELIGKSEMLHYFPDGHLVDEKLAGLTKSLIAVRSQAGSAPQHADGSNTPF